MLTDDITYFGWYFAPQGAAPDKGANDPAMQNFRGASISVLGREIGQNSLDAADGSGNPVCIVFKKCKVPVNKIPGWTELVERIKDCVDYWKPTENDAGNPENLLTMKNIYNHAQRINQQGYVEVLRVSDFCTHGLRGSDKTNNTEWCSLTHSIGSTLKFSGSGGSVGIGKVASFCFSGIRTVFYGTKDETGKEAFAGISILSSSRRNGKKFLGDGIWARLDEEKEYCFPLNSYSTIADNFSNIFTRTEIGTDVFIMDFIADENWESELIKGIIEDFMVAIYDKKLEVVVENTKICAENLSELIDKYTTHLDNDEKTECDYTQKYYSALASFDKEYNEPNLYDYGNVKLYVKLAPDADKHGIYCTRRPGMKIKINEGIGRLLPMNFFAVLKVIGHGGQDEKDWNNLLQLCEDVHHLNWSEKNCNREKDKIIAGSMIPKLKKWILSQLKDAMPDIQADSVKAYGLEDLFPAVGDEGNNQIEINAFKELKFADLKNPDRKRKKHKENIVIADNDTPKDEDDYDPTPDDIENDPASFLRKNKNGVENGSDDIVGHGQSNSTGGSSDSTSRNPKNELYSNGDKSGYEEADGNTDNQDNNKKPAIMRLLNVRSIYQQKLNKYRIIFTPASKASDIKLAVRALDYNGTLQKVGVISAELNGRSLKTSGSHFHTGPLEAEQRVCVDVVIPEEELCLEVRVDEFMA